MPVTVIRRTLLIVLVTFGKVKVLGHAVVKCPIKPGCKLTPTRRSRVYGDAGGEAAGGPGY